ncbi:MAG: methyl-accepting chemotaxis protein [Gammaproteobacteria bacterium]
MAQTRPTAARGTILTYIVGIVALLCIIAAAADFFFVAQSATYDNEFLSNASVAAVQSQALAGDAQKALDGNRAAFGTLDNGANKMDGAIALMGNGDSRTLLPGASGLVATNLQLLRSDWRKTRPAVKVIVGARDSVLVANQAAAAVRRTLPTYVSDWNALLARMADNNASGALLTKVAAQPVQAAETGREMESLMSGRGNLDAVGNSFKAHVNRFGDVLNALVDGSTELNIAALPNKPALQAALGRLMSGYRSLNNNLQVLAPLAGNIVTWQQALAQIRAQSPQMLSDAQTVVQAYQAQRAARPFKPLYGYILGAIALLLIILLVLRYQLTGDARRAARAQLDQNERNQEAILRLLDELGTLADGDLTVELGVTEDITGAIADSINYTVEALRELVVTINDTAVEVDGAARQTEATASQLAEAAENQNRQVGSATESITRMASSIEQVSANSQRASEVAQHSVDVAHNGGEAVRRTIEGMTSIREAIQETSKRMKRLGESSQEIGDIVELINDIAEQTNILALNAAIQASTAGEAGRGFGVVADEVQRLAERAGSATRQIETLVRTIQSDTNEAILSMEQSTSGVVSGAQLAENAGHALDEIEQVSNTMESLIGIISGAAREQAQVAGEVSGTMGVIREITSQTAEGTAVTARSIGKLAALSADLRRSVSGFTLPDSQTREKEAYRVEDEEGAEEQATEHPFRTAENPA